MHMINEIYACFLMFFYGEGGGGRLQVLSFYAAKEMTPEWIQMLISG